VIQVELADPAITVHGWTRDLDKLGQYTLRLRKTPEEMKAEREHLKQTFGGKAKKVNPLKFENGTVIEHSPDDPGTVYFLPGLWPRVKGYLEANGIEYEITADYRNPDIRPPIDYEAIKDVQFRETQDLALALIATSDCGIIDCAVGYGKSFMCGIICKAFPTLRILITTGSTQVVSTLYEYLCKQVPGEVGIIMGGKNTAHNKRIVVCTLRSLEKIQSTGPQLVITDECHEIGANLAAKELMRFAFARRFGMSASPIRNDGSALVLESVLGPTILHMSYDDASEQGIIVPMRYAMLHCNWVPSICHKEDVSEIILKRFAYWRNEARNRVIADFVNRLHKANPDIQILIMVQTLEAACALHMKLPWFKVANYGNVDVEDLRRKFPQDKFPNFEPNQYKMTSKTLDIMRGAFAKGTLRFIISTTVFRQGVNFPHLRVLIRADGATSAIMGIQIPGRLSRLDEDKDCAYLVDIDDTGCAWSKRRALCREQLYEEQKWTKTTPEDIINDFKGQAAADITGAAGPGSTEEH